MAHMRIATVSYENRPLKQSENGLSLGQQIDNAIYKSIEAGKLVQEVSFFIETPEEQHAYQEAFHKKELVNWPEDRPRKPY